MVFANVCEDHFLSEDKRLGKRLDKKESKRLIYKEGVKVMFSVFKKKEKKYGKLRRIINDKEEYLEINSQDEASEWGTALYSEWSNKYKEVMKIARGGLHGSHIKSPLQCYCGWSYRNINEYLREGRDDSLGRNRELSNLLMVLLCSAPRIPEDLILYRIVDDRFINKLIQKNKVGSAIQERGFMSTSLLKDIARQEEPYNRGNNMLKIYVPKGTIGVYVNVVDKRNEEEILLFPNYFLGLIDYPYTDEDTEKVIYECKLFEL